MTASRNGHLGPGFEEIVHTICSDQSPDGPSQESIACDPAIFGKQQCPVRGFEQYGYHHRGGFPRGGQSKGTGFQIDWQPGPMGTNPDGSRTGRTGALVEEVLAACWMRIQDYQLSAMHCVDNDDALDELGDAINALLRRREERVALGIQGVEGTEEEVTPAPAEWPVEGRFTKLPVTIEAKRFHHDEHGTNGPGCETWSRGKASYVADGPRGPALVVETREGRIKALPGDWLIRGVEGEVYPCADAIFRKTYRPEHQGRHFFQPRAELAEGKAATDAEALAGTATDRFVSPAQVSRIVDEAMARVGCAPDTTAVATATDPMEAGRRAYDRYAEGVGGRTHDDRRLPEWHELGDRQRCGWIKSAMIPDEHNPLHGLARTK